MTQTLSVRQLRLLQAKNMKESGRNGLQEQVRILFRDSQYDWLYYHTHRSQYRPAGFPDVFAIRISPSVRIVIAECKTQAGKVTTKQQLWLDTMKHAMPAAEVYVWRPMGLLNGTIRSIIEAR